MGDILVRYVLMASTVGINLRACAAACNERVYAAAPVLEECAHHSFSHVHVDAVLDAASALLENPDPDVCANTAVAFRPLLLELVARRSHRAETVHALAFLIGAFEECYTQLESFLQRHFPHGLPVDDELHLTSLLRIVRAAPHIAHRLGWRSSYLYKVFASKHGTPATLRLLAIECYAIQEHLSNAARDALRQAWVGDAPAPLHVLHAHTIDVRLFPVYEQERIEALWRACEEVTPLTTPVSDTSAVYVTPEHLSPSLTCVASMIMPSNGASMNDTFVATPSAQDTMRQILLHVSLRLPVLLSGPAACGKTHLLTYLATRLSHPKEGMPPFLSIPLGDQSGVDAKALLGSYVSSSTKPGTFEFVEGALTRAVRAGVWVILEDLDKASTDVLSVLAPLAEALGPTKTIGARPILDLGPRGKVVAAPGFALLGTRCVRPEAPRAMFLSSEHWGDVRLSPPQAEDIAAILNGRFPSMSALPMHECACLINAWYGAVDASQRAPASVRKPTLRELVQWCGRVDSMRAPSLLDNPVVQDAVFLDACDVFLASFSELTPVARSIAHALSNALQISSERAKYTLQDRVPNLALGHAGYVRIGRMQLERRKPGAPTLQRYALTRTTLASMERVASCIAHAEPALLVGETGTGKTTMVQTLASLIGQPITVVNLSQQTESGDLLGAFKPLDPKSQAADLHNAWTRVFERTFSLKRNAAYVDAERKAFFSGKWARLAKLWYESCKMAQRELAQNDSRKKRRTDGSLESDWSALATRVASFSALFAKGQRHFAFSFVEGPLVRAVQEGHWILLDEINLASPETLDCLAPLLQSKSGSIVLTERGDLAPIPRHERFRLFACMNPATDVGKRDLPPSFRARFTEIYVPSPDADKEALMNIVAQYIGQEAASDKAAVMDVADLYMDVRHAAAHHELADGANQRPHYSVRTLARALTFAAALAPAYGLRRALMEGMTMSFGMLLDAPSALAFQNMLDRHLLVRAKDRRTQRTFVPSSPGPDHVRVGAFWLEAGPVPPDPAPEYVLTASVEAKINALARALVTRQSPVLIQGPTSAGKTSAVEYLARRTGHRFVRINNHEHTDVQEYLGAYASNAEGQLVFSEGLLVTALRRGDWLVLDELNLAPTDVLEALNRLLDDNRELMIPETGEIVRPHPHFMLFATQNPPGAYAGRKVLSRAFRNRFVELHFDDVPETELAAILTTRCVIPPSWAEKIVAVFTELQRRRQSGRVFEKHAFATLRDLFRWGMRGADGYQQLADTGYMLLAERTRHPRDAATVQDVLQQIMRVRIDPEALYDKAETLEAQLGPERLARLRTAADEQRIVWTSSMRRLVCLTAAALQQNEPVLLVGETGAGKTSVCDILAAAFGRSLYSFNCHQNTDSADLLGSQRPLRNRASLAAEARLAAERVLLESVQDMPLEQLAARLQAAKQKTPSQDLEQALFLTQRALALFTWCDGPLVEAMRQGDFMLLDEISLADDSVLERLNSVLERERTLVLAEKAGTDVVVTAAPGFQIIATMNPGGDYGKKELSPALRNRFTEIFVPPVERADDQAAIVQALLPESLYEWTQHMLTFVHWFAHQVGGHDQTGLGVRDLVGWATFLREVCARDILPPALAFAHGAALTIIDAVGALPATAAMTQASLHSLRIKCYQKVNAIIAPVHFDPFDPSCRAVRETPDTLFVGPFSMDKGPLPKTTPPFQLQAGTAADNAMRVLRACSIRGRSVLLEGSPGAGKTSLITSIAAMTGHELVRINLSEQTELVDLFGAELPVENGRPGEFAWRPAAFLDAMQRGAWVLLDEMNLASQTVLEGLNSCLDHRGSVYVAEIGRTFTKHADFRLFAAQNPQHQGGARKGLPKSLLNRFIKVYVSELQDDDIRVICERLYPDLSPYLDAMVSFHADLHRATQNGSIGRHGSPWELNLRDQLRWMQIMHADLGCNTSEPIEALRFLYIARFRTQHDRDAVADLFAQHFGCDARRTLRMPPPLLSPSSALLGHVYMERLSSTSEASMQRQLALVPSQLACLEGMAASVRLGLLTIITGYTGAGKSCIVRTMADLVGMPLEEVRLSAASDTMDVLGSFEQRDPSHVYHDVSKSLYSVLRRMQARSHLSDGSALDAIETCLTALEHGGDPRSTELVLPYALHDEHEAITAQLDRLDVPTSAGGQFEWIDGPLIRAAKRGHWLLLDNANLCAASVLDRLNSLFEPSGSLVLSERGMVEGAVPHIVPDAKFRVFMTVDPRHGELSRAMRNRGMELWLDSVDPAFLAPFARAFGGRGSLVDRAVYSHAIRRGLNVDVRPPSEPKAVRAASSQPALKDAGLPGAAFVTTCMKDHTLHEAACIYAVQALVPSELALVVRTVSNLPVPYSISGVTAASPHVLSSLLPADVRRLPDAEPRADELYARTLELHVRSALQVQALQKPPRETSWLAKMTDDVHQVPAVLQHMPIFLATCVSLAQAKPTSLEMADRFAGLLDSVYFLQHALQADELDYSLVYLILNNVRSTVSELAQLGMDIPTALPKLLRDMHAPQSQHTGVAMQALWAQLLPDAPPRLLSLLAELELHFPDALSAAHAKTVLQVLSTLYLSNTSWNEAQCAELSQLAQSLLGIRHERSAESLPFVARVLPAVLWTLAADSGTWDTRTRLSQLIHLWAQHPCVPASLMVSIQLRAWSLTQPIPPMLQMRYARALWYADGSFSIEAPGSLVLQRATILPAVLDAVHMDRVSLSLWPTYDSHLYDLAVCVATALVPAQPPRMSMAAHMLRVFMAQISRALYSAVESVATPETQTRLHAWKDAIDAQNEQSIVHALSSVVTTLGSSPIMHTALQSWLSWLRTTQHCLSSQVRSPFEIGAAWVRLALLTLQIYIPDVPLDPVAEAHAQHAYNESIQTRLARREHVEKAAESFRTGSKTNVVVEKLQEALTDIAQRLACDTRTRVQRAPQTARLERLHAELIGFARQVATPARLERVLTSMAAESPSAVAEEASLQASLYAFEQRLLRQYSSLHDLTAPVHMAIEQLRLGLRLCLPSESASAKKQRVLDAAMQFPTSQAAHTMLCRATEPRSVATAVTELLAALAAAAFEAQTLRATRVPLATVQIVYEQLFVLWAKQRDAEREKAEADAKLFSFKDEDASEEQERIHAEIKALFPVYEDVLENKNNNVDPSKSDASRLDPDTVIRVYDLHRTLYPSALSLPGKRRVPDVADMLVEQCDSLLRHSASFISRLPMDSDRFAAYQLTRIARRRAPPKRLKNFYHDPQPHEIARIVPILNRLQERVAELLRSLPEQVQLQQLMERSERTTQLDVSSPVAKGLAAIELLLTHVDDWETYASRDLSLQVHASELTNLVVEWRRLELHSWRTLLDDEAAREEATVATWFFSLYEAITRSAASDASLSAELVDLLDSFIRGSTAGQIGARLDLLDTFSTFLQHDKPSLSQLLHNAAAYYAQFMPAIDAHIAQQRETLDREIADYVKLATWKDVNVFALKQSAQKTHTYLHKSLRKFREILRQPADPLLTFKADARPSLAVRPLMGPGHIQFSPVTSDSHAQSVPQVPRPSDTTRAPHLQDMKRTVAHLHERSAHFVVPGLQSHAYADLVNLGTTVLETADALAQQTPAVANEKNIKAIKSLASQKRRAWTDLLKTLRHIGLSPFVTAELLSHNRSPSQAYGVPRLETHEHLGTDSLSKYYAAMLAQAERLRHASQTPVGDVPDLVRGLALVEHSVYTAMRLRYRMSSVFEDAKDVWALTERLAHLHGPLTRISAPCLAQICERVNQLARVSQALDEIVATTPMLVEVSPMMGAPDLSGIQSQNCHVRQTLARLTPLAHVLQTTRLYLCTKKELDLVDDSTSVLQNTLTCLNNLTHATPALSLVTVPTSEWLESYCTNGCGSTTAESDEEADTVQTLSDKVCSSILVIAQELARIPPPEQSENLAERLVVNETARLQQVDRILRPQAVAQAIRDALSGAGSGELTQACIQDLSKFLRPYTEWLWVQVSSVSLWSRAIMRLTLILSVIMTSLATKGFCQPPEETQAEDDNGAEGGEQLEGGTGLGEGSGAKDVSDTLKDDETMEELKNEEEPPNDDQDENESSKGEDKAREMDDMDGDVHSVDGDQQQDDQEAAEDEDEQEQDVEDEVGDLDPLDPDAVDEKMWADEPEKPKQGDSEVQGETQDDREQAGERNEPQDGQQDESNEAGQDGDDGDENKPNDEDEQDEAEVEDMPELNEGLGRELDKEAAEEDMQLGDIDMGDEGDDGENNEDDQDDLDQDLSDGAMDDDVEERMTSSHEQDTQQREQENDDIPDDQDMEQDGEMQQAQDDDVNDSDDSTSPPGAEDAQDKGQSTSDDDEDGDEDTNGNDAKKANHNEMPASQPNQQDVHNNLERQVDLANDLPSEVAEEYNATHEGGGQDSGGAAGQQDRASGDTGRSDGSSSAQDQGARQESSDARAEGKDESESTSQPNPIQSLGDSLEQFRRDVDSIREATDHAQDDEPLHRDGAIPEAQDMEHIAPDQDADAQALGTADEQQAHAMKNLSMDDADQADSSNVALPEEPDTEMSDPTRATNDALPDAEETGSQPHGAREGAMLASDVQDVQDKETKSDLPDTQGEEEHMDPLADDERLEADKHVAKVLESFRASDADIDRASELWRSYTALTTDLAFSLCEQLRLILAPTLATRLSGDYRTGKRLNMRKIIPFIASDFAKDKIWLRRTKPSAREYQVLLAIDDSKSMAESRNIHLAYQTLALVAGALTRLEIGDVGICRFGTEMNMLHDFGSTTFTDRHGGQILSHLRFDQTRTDMFALLEQSMRVLRQARQQHTSASAADLWQLEIIISDGVCQDHERLKALLRRATEERIMLVFVVVDAAGDVASASANEGQRSSILSMNQVSYHTDAAGRLQLNMKHYMDTFPFDYYVIVRDVQSLPQVLATTLCQWAERIRDA